MPGNENDFRIPQRKLVASYNEWNRGKHSSADAVKLLQAQLQEKEQKLQGLVRNTQELVSRYKAAQTRLQQMEAASVASPVGRPVYGDTLKRGQKRFSRHVYTTSITV